MTLTTSCILGLVDDDLNLWCIAGAKGLSILSAFALAGHWVWGLPVCIVWVSFVGEFGGCIVRVCGLLTCLLLFFSFFCLWILFMKWYITLLCVREKKWDRFITCSFHLSLVFFSFDLMGSWGRVLRGWLDGPLVDTWNSFVVVAG